MQALIPVITIDGPSGTGKGTVSRLLAQQLGWHFLDSGALYRLVAYGAEKAGISLDDHTALSGYARHLPVTFNATSLADEPRIMLDNQDVTEGIRTESAGNAASVVAAVPAVREALLVRQRDFRQPPGLVADGRDMGTTVFPDADIKVFLTASTEERAKRRYKQLKEKGNSVSLTALVQDITDRDERDANRPVYPLKPPKYAVIVDTTELAIDAVLQRVMELIPSTLMVRER